VALSAATPRDSPLGWLKVPVLRTDTLAGRRCDRSSNDVVKNVESAKINQALLDEAAQLSKEAPR